MLLGIISDTHGSVRAWREALAGPLAAADQIFHGGDLLYHGPRNPFPSEYDPQELALLINQCSVPVFAVRGNCDSEVDQMLLAPVLQCPYLLADHPRGRILVTHGHHFNYQAAQALAGRLGVKIWISGHTHEPLLEQKGALIFLNPGSPALPKGDLPRRSVALISSEEIQLIDIDASRPLKVFKF
ncbi:MAG: phosphodiesterase [Firmicutes bacterium]|nr:phosphodiesterase [Bacillota bacterium]